MNEVEKMYENCNIKPKQEGYCDWDSDCPYPDIIHNGCGDECSYWKYEDEAKYPPFTPEKQLELIKWLLKKWMDVRFVHNLDGIYYISSFNNVSYTGKNLDECIVSFVNNAWRNLTEAERKQIRGILE